MKKYLILCEKRERFRAELVEVLRKRQKQVHETLPHGTNLSELKAKGTEEQTDNFITDTDKDILRYYYYVAHGIKDVYVGSMDPDLLARILDMVPVNWRTKFRNSLYRLIEEVKEEYALDVKRAVVEFVIGHSSNASLSNKVLLYRFSFVSFNLAIYYYYSFVPVSIHSKNCSKNVAI